MKKSKMKKFVLPIACTLLLFACSKDSDNSKNSNASSLSEIDVSAYISENISYEEEDYRTNWEDENPISITLNGDKVSYDESAAIMTSGTTVTIRSGGVYVLSGDLEDGQIVVDAPDTGKVQIVLNGVDIHNSKSAAIFSKDDLTINGTGVLEVVGNYDNGIGSKDDLRIMEGTIKVTAVDDAILGRDLVAIKSGTFEIDAGGDGIKSTNTNDTKGIIAIEDGMFNIKAGTDGIQAESSLYVADGDFTITAGGGSPETIDVREEMMGSI